ncbi:MAG: amidohydrolase family protein, partial [Myxococcota bacterium]
YKRQPMTPAARLLRGATVVHGPGAPPRPDTDVLIVGDRIAAIGPDLPPPDGGRVLDVGGAWIVPGWIDAHVHLLHVPGQDWLAPDLVASLRRRDLASFVACGVTTVLDAGTVRASLDETRGWIADGAVAPRVVVLGEALGPAGGYPSVMSPAFTGLASVAEVGPALDRAVAMGAVGAKVTFERGFGRQDLPLFDPAMRRAIRGEAADRGLPLFVHAMTPADYLPALDLAPRAFVHGPEDPDPAVTEAIAASDAWVITTATLYDAPLEVRSARGLADPLVQAAVPPELVAAALDRETAIRSRRALAAMTAPWAPDWLASMGVAARWLSRRELHRALAALRDLHDAGVPLVVGTDTGTWPLLHGQLPGWATVRELELLAEAGLDPAEVLAAATIAPARLLGLDDDLGTIEVGKVADLVVLGRDPTVPPRAGRPSAWRSVRYTVHDGVADTPSGWIGR